MAYSVNGKIYTDHPLMDEIVNCCKTIFNGIVVKNDALALSYETDESLEESREYINIVENKETFATFPFTYQMLASFKKNGTRVFSDNFIQLILEDRNNIPTELRTETLNHCRKYYINNYDERNNYYRSLAGLPPYPGTVYNIKRDRSDSQYNIYIYESDFPSDYDTSHIDFSKPIHLQSANDISILQYNGVLDNIIKEYRGFNYSYLRYLGYKAISIYKARKAIKWEILYMPAVEQLVEQRFEELYNINRSIYLKRTYQTAMSLGSNHFDESVILLLLCQTFNDMIVDVPEWYIRRDIFDIRSVQYFLESFGVEFFDVIPLKYQVAIVKNLNKLIKYKSSTKNNNDIIDLFNLEGTYIYKYFLYKKKINETSSEDLENYDLEFIKVKQGEPFDKFIDNNIYRYKYDDLTLSDKFWDGVYKEWNDTTDKSFKEKLHEEIRDDHIEDADYTVEGTKYMSIDYEVDMSKFKYQVEYFFSYLLDSEVISDDLKIIVPSISTSTEVGIADLFVMLYLLSFAYEGVSDKIRRPEDTTSHKLDIVTPRVKYYEQLYRDDGDFDDYISWNEKFGKYIPPAPYDTMQFYFGTAIKQSSLDDDEEFNFGDIIYNLDYLQGEYDFDELAEEEPIDQDKGYDFIDPNFNTDSSDEEASDNRLYDFGDVYFIPPPTDGDRYDFNTLIDINPDEYFEQFFNPKHWEVKSYIENQDPDATAEGYNSYPIWVENYRDWAKRRVPEVLNTSYNRINGFNNKLTTDDLDKFLEVITRRNKVYNYEKGYTGYSYNTVYNDNGDISYYEITYEYDELQYTFEEYRTYINPDATIDDYNGWLADNKTKFMRSNPRGPLGIGGFRIVKELNNIEDIMNNFDINTICYNDLVDRITNSNNRDENILLRYVFNTLFTREFDYKFYQANGIDAEYLKEVLKDRSYILYNYYNQIISENNTDTRKNNIRAVMNDIITTLEYYITGDNVEFIYSSFSISSFNALLYYIYLMINFFKSWKVYFLDPVVTVNTDDKLESGNNYGAGIDSISEIKLNYWHEDKEFKRDRNNTNLVIYHDDMFRDQIREVLDVYGHFDPDPQDDYDYDGFTVEEVQSTYKDADGGVADGKLNIPFKMINGGKSYGKLLDIWDLDGAGPLEMQEYLRVDGGGVYHSEDIVTRNSFDNLYNYIINGGNAGTNEFWTKSIHTRVVDRQIEQDVLVSDMDANLIVEDENGIYIQQAWASWKEFDDIRDVGEEAFEYIDYIMEVLYDDLIVITDDTLLTQRINELVSDQLYNMRKVSNYVNEIEHHKKNYKDQINQYIDSLNDEFANFSPYDWIDF